MHLTPRRMSAFFLTAALVCAVVFVARANSGRIEPDARELLEKAAAHLAEKKAFSFEFSSEMILKAPGENQNMLQDYAVQFERPNRLRFESRGETRALSLASNGTTVGIYSAQLEGYRVTDAPASLAGVSPQEVPELSFAGMAGVVLLPALMSDNFAEKILDNVTSASLGPAGEVAGAKTQVVHLEQADGLTVDLHFAADGEPLLLKVRADLTEVLRRNAQGISPGDELLFVNTVDFDDWNTTPRLGDDVFAFVPPEGAKEVDLAELMSRGQPTHPLLGKQAEDFTLTALDGKEVSLAGLKDKVVVLDFWASWCGPCVMALPLLSSATLAMKDQGVEFYAVNQGESKEQVEKFLKQQKLDLPVLLDEKGAVGDKFGVQGIPQTVIIDKAGKVQVVHVGFGPGMEKMLTKELEQILAGKDLAEEKLSKDNAASPAADNETTK